MGNEVCIVIPALNEPYLPTLLNNLHNYNVNVRGDKGLSFAVWKGIQQSKGKFAVVMDADGSHRPDAIPEMLNLLDENIWLVVGSKYCKGGYSHDSTLRKTISLFYCFVARALLRTHIRDPMSGFWVGYTEAFRFNPSSSFKFGIQLIKNNRGHIAEYPIVFRKRQLGKSKVEPLQAIKDLLAIFRR